MIFSVNVLDWHQSRFDNSHSISDQVWKNTMIMLDILRSNEIIGTFFIHDKVVLKYPVLVRKISQEGHEIGCLIDTPYHRKNYPRKNYQQVVQLAVHELEAVVDRKVIGIRSKGLNILKTNFYHYCKILNEMGIQYDSSLATNKSVTEYEKKNSSIAAFDDYQITEYPQALLLTPPLSGRKPMPFGGKAFRFLNYEACNLFVGRLNKLTSVFSMPVYDLGYADYAPTKSDYQLTTSNKLDFVNRSSIPPKLNKLFADYPFDSFANYYRLKNRQN